MVDVGGDDHATTGNFVANQLGRELLLLPDILHLLSDDAFAGEMHLREVAVTHLGGLGATFGDPLCARPGNACSGKIFGSGASIAVSIAVTGHRSAFLPEKPLIIRAGIQPLWRQ